MADSSKSSFSRGWLAAAATLISSRDDQGVDMLLDAVGCSSMEDAEALGVERDGSDWGTLAQWFEDKNHG